MISVVLYGRNDAHGYNLHRRAALSLNCLAEVLTDPDDEIVFVDYNTPDELPTFIEALEDTLTERCLDRLRVLRVRAAVHAERYRERTHLPIVEGVARNAAVRRANPANRWVLSTNTDMIMLPLDDESLTDVCRRLTDGFYGLPRFEVPEWLWEALPRTEPRRVLAELAALGPALRLDEHTLSDAWIRFDAPGDFQLCLRDDFIAIDGFNEEMLLGWHVDSNLSRRMMLHRGSIESLDDRLAGYHCNHNRTPTVYHEAVGVANDLGRFYLHVDGPQLSAQRDTWGLAGLHLEETALRDRGRGRFTDALITATSTCGTRPVVSSATDAIFAVTYDSVHVLPFAADAIAVARGDSAIGYLGANTTFESLLARFVSELDGDLMFISARGDVAVEELNRADILVVDFGLDAGSGSDNAEEPVDFLGFVPFPAPLRAVLDAFKRIVEEERARIVEGAHPRPMILVNSATVYTDPYVRSHLDCSYTTPHSRIRRATVKLAPVEDETTRAASTHADRLLGWVERDDDAGPPPSLRPGEHVDFRQLEDFSAFGEGWLFPEQSGIWTRGTRAELAFTLEGTKPGRYLFTLFVGRVGAAHDELLEVELLINGARVDSRAVPGGAHAFAWRVPLPDDAVATGSLEVQLEVREARVWSQDERQLGLYVKGFLLQRDGWSRRLVDTLARLRHRA